MYDNSSRVLEIDIDDILPNRFQPRIQFDEEEILDLSDSIKEHGVIQPIVVRQLGEKYEIISGERRYKASVLAGKETIPVIVKNLNDKDSAEIALIENVQRKNLTPIEEALSYKKILDMGYITQENLAMKIGKSQSSIANKIRLLNLSDEVQEALLENKISERHARSLLKLDSYKEQNDMLERIISERLTVRKTDEEIEKLKNSNNVSTEETNIKIEEKGEDIMENNNVGTFNVPNNSQASTFDIFASTSQSAPMQTPFDAPSTPVFNIPSMSEVQPTQTGSSSSLEVPIAPVGQPIQASIDQSASMPSILGVPSVESAPSTESAPMQTSFDAPSTPVFPSTSEVQPTQTGTPSSFEVPSVPVEQPIQASIDQSASMPSILGVPSVESAPSIESAPMQTSFDAPSAPVEQPTLETPSNVQQAVEVPVTAPIIESSSEPNLTVPTAPEAVNSSANEEPENPVYEFKTPEPIIVTDFSKQYDPVMPKTEIEEPQKVEFKEVIAAIRECSQKIEQYGYKVDVDEYDLTSLYQVVFKVEK